MMSAPARMNPRWSERTLSGARMFASSGQRSRATALETSVPIPPSPTSGGPSASRSRKRPDMARPVYAGSEVTLSTHFGGAVKRLRVTPAAGESRRLRSLTTGSDAAAARVRSLRGEGAVPPSEELAGDGEAGAWRLPRSVPCLCTDRDSRARISIVRQSEDAREEGRPRAWPSADLQPLKRRGRRADSDSNSWLGTDGNQLRPGASEKGAADDAALSHAQDQKLAARVSDRANNEHQDP